MWLFYLLLFFIWSSVTSGILESTWYQWGPWSQLPEHCSVTCGSGVRCRVRRCLSHYGIVQSSDSPCVSPGYYGPKAESCVSCVVNARCPTIPGWSKWSPWSRCTSDLTNTTIRRGGCLVGLSVRSRRCDNPPPERQPYGMSCMGPRHDIRECFYRCTKLPDTTPDDIAKLIQLQIEADHRLVRYPHKAVLRKYAGEKVTMSCETAAYKLAKRLTVTGVFSAARRGLLDKMVSITWYRNGRNVHSSDFEVRGDENERDEHRRLRRNKYADEELRWNKLTRPSELQVEDPSIIIQSITEGDQGFYTCELSYLKHRWLARFYSLIVIGVRYVAQATDPFYLHSNLGFSNALRRAPVWLESAQIVWQLNGVEQSRGLAVRSARRIQKIEHLNHTHQGMWLCFLAIPAPGPSERMTSPTTRIVSSYLINEFHLKINPATNSLWQIAENPPSVRILRNVATFLSMACLFFILLFLLTVWATRRWINRSLRPSQRRAIMDEILDDATRLMLTARVRATVNKEKLLPLILQEERRLGQADEHIKEVLKDQTRELHPSIINRMSRMAKLSRMASSFMHFGKSFYLSPSLLQSKDVDSPKQSIFRRFSRIANVEGSEDDDQTSPSSSYTPTFQSLKLSDSTEDSNRRRSSRFSRLIGAKGVSTLKLLISSRKASPKTSSDGFFSHLNINASPKGSPATKLIDPKVSLKPRQSLFSMGKELLRRMSLTRPYQTSQSKESTQPRTETLQPAQPHEQLKPQCVAPLKKRQSGCLKQQPSPQGRRTSAGRPQTQTLKAQQPRMHSPQRPQSQSSKASHPHSSQITQPHSPQRPRLQSPQQPRLQSPKPSHPHSPERPQPHLPQRPRPQSSRRPRLQSPKPSQPHSPQRPRLQSPKPQSPKLSQPHSPQRPQLHSPQRPRLQSPKPQSPKPSHPYSSERPQPHSPQRPRLQSPKPSQPHSPQRPRLQSPQPQSPKLSQPHSPQRPQPHSPQRPRLQSQQRPQRQSPKPPHPHSPQRPRLQSPQPQSPKPSQPHSPQRPRLQSPKPQSPKPSQPHSPQRPRLQSSKLSQPHSPQRPRLQSPQPQSPKLSQPHSPQRPRLQSPQPQSPKLSQPHSPQRPRLQSPQRIQQESEVKLSP
ncbi:unnamed protein product [Calicophoron daubneyi]|uniref:Ig-like domain-containing protein n=1 Tax=Calicophoron daubneyi TaxID=300641 RepID=A0AAV2T487_CALDB